MTRVVAECRPTWIIRNNTRSVGATLIVEPIQAAECLSRCAVTASCVAVDVLYSCTPPQCWMHHNSNNIRRHYYGADNIQYEVVTRCATMAPPVSGNLQHCHNLIIITGVVTQAEGQQHPILLCTVFVCLFVCLLFALVTLVLNLLFI